MLKTLFREAGYTQRSISLKLGCTRQTVSAWVAGKICVTAKYYKGLKDLGIDITGYKNLYPGSIKNKFSVKMYELGFTQTDLANELDCSRTLVHLWCNGKARIGVKLLYPLYSLGFTKDEIDSAELNK